MDRQKNFLLALLALAPSLAALLLIESAAVLHVLARLLAISALGFSLTHSLTPTVACYTRKAGLCGKDLGKKGSAREDIPV